MKPIQFKRTCTPGLKPSACELSGGEIALNLADGVVYSKDCSGAIVPLSGGDIDGGTYSGPAVSYNCNGNYTCVQVAGAGGSYATLEACQELCAAPVVNNPPSGSGITITSQPTNQVAVSGAATLSITAINNQNSDALVFGWQWWNTFAWMPLGINTTGTMPFGNGRGFSWSITTSGSSSTLQLTGVTAAGNAPEKFQCIVSAFTVPGVRSNEVSVSVS